MPLRQREEIQELLRADGVGGGLSGNPSSNVPPDGRSFQRAKRPAIRDRIFASSASVSGRGSLRPRVLAKAAASSLNSAAVPAESPARSAANEPTMYSASIASSGNGPRAPFPVVSAISQPAAIRP